MIKKLYLNLFFSLLILLIGYSYARTFNNFWTIKIICFFSIILAGLFFTGFKFNQVPNKINQPIKSIYFIPIAIGIIGLFLTNYFIPFLYIKLMKTELNNDILLSETNLPRFLIMMILTVFLEELYFRRFIAQKILNEKTFSKAIWLSALSFSVGHFFSNTGLLIAFIGGLFLGYIYLKTKNLFLSFLTHLIFNLLSIFIVPKINTKIDLFDSNTTIASIIILGFGLIFIMIYSMEKLIPKKQ